MTTVAVLIPTRDRAQQMKRNVGALLAQERPPSVELHVVLAIADDDWDSFFAAVELPDVLLAPREAGTTAVEGWNIAYDMIGCDWYVLGADDIVWHEGWLEEALCVAEQTGAQVVGLNDGHTDLNQYAPHYMAHWKFCSHVLGGHIAPPEYMSWWFDREVCERARTLGVYAPAPDAVAEHMHPDWGKAQTDATYESAKEFHDSDRALYLRRKEKTYES